MVSTLHLASNNAICTAVKRQLLQKKPVLTDVVWQPSQLFQHLWQQWQFSSKGLPLRQISAIQLHVIAVQCLQALPHLTKAYKLGDRDLKQLSKPLIDAHILVLQYLVPQQYLEQCQWDLELFYQWHKLLLQRLEQLQLVTSAQLVQKIVEQDFEHSMQDTRLYLYDLEHILTPLEQRLLAKIFPHQKKATLQAQKADVKRHIAESQTEELHDAIGWAQQIHRQQPEAKIAIIVNSLTNDRALVRRTVAHYQSQLFNISGGLPLSDNASLNATIVLANLFGKKASYQQLQQLIQLPLLQFQTADGRCQLLQKLYHNQYYYYRPQQWLKLLSSFLVLQQAQALQDFHTIVKTTASPSQWLLHWLQLLEFLGWKFQYKFAYEYKVWSDLCHQLKGLDSILEPIKYSHWLFLWQKLLQRKVALPVESQRINIIDTLDGAVGFSHLWLCGASKDNWPKAINPNPLLPIGLQRQFNMPNCQWHDALFACNKLLGSLYQRCKHLVVSYDIELGDAGIAHCYENIEQKCTLENADRQHSSTALETYTDQKPPNVSIEEREGLKGGVTLLENICQSPFHAFVIHRLKAQKLDPPKLGLSPLDRGSFVHKILEKFYLHFLQSAVTLDCNTPPQQWQQILSQLIQQKLQDRQLGFELPIQLAIEQKLLTRLLKQAVEFELANDVSQFTVEQLEQATKVTIKNLKFSIRIDRIDINVKTKKRRLIDYKTGANLPSIASCTGEGDAPLLKPQLPLYALAQKSPELVAGLIYFQINDKELKWLDVLRDNTIAELIPQWQQYFDCRIDEFLQGSLKIEQFDEAYKPLTRHFD